MMMKIIITIMIMNLMMMTTPPPVEVPDAPDHHGSEDHRHDCGYDCDECDDGHDDEDEDDVITPLPSQSPRNSGSFGGEWFFKTLVLQ